jgi:hypothetical protein
MSSPTTRTLSTLREEGWLCAVVEKFNTFNKTRLDLYGFIDIIAVRENETLAVQATSYANTSSRVTKIKAHENYTIVKSANWRIEVWGWKKCLKTSKKGKTYYRYFPRIIVL